MIACVFIPEFAIVVAREYHGISPDWPLIVASYTQHRGKIYAASPEARLRGVQAGMASHKGLALCPQAVLVSRVESPQRRAADELLEALCGFSDRLELALDHTATIWIDLGNIADAAALERANEIRETAIDRSLFLPAIGLAGGKFPARIAAVMAGEGAIQRVADGEERQFLTAFPVARLALTTRQHQHFKLLGIETLGQLAALPAHAAHEQFGAVGKRLHALARGIDPQPVAPYTPRLKHYREQQFEPPVDDRGIIEAVLQKLAAELAAYMTAKGLATQALVLTLHLDSKQVIEKHFTPREPTASQMGLYAHLVRLLNDMRIDTPVAGIEVGIEDLALPVPKQLDFFGQLFADPGNLSQIVDQLLPRYGLAPFQQVHVNPHGSAVPERGFRFKGVT